MATTTIFPPDRVTIVGVLNTTPDSFSDGGRFVRGEGQVDVEAAVDAAAALIGAGADVIDVGGESTRPGAREVPTALEIDRTASVIEGLGKRFEVPISIDTRKEAVAEVAFEAGAVVVNDVSGLGFDPGLAGAAARAGATLVLGHLRGNPATMQDDPRFADTLQEVGDELEASLERARAAGLPDERLAVDPGLGFGKSLGDNLALIAGVGSLRRRLGLPVMLGPSRKSFLGALSGEPVERRDPATWAVCAVAAFAGADALRVHEVGGAVRAAALGRALREARREGSA